MQNQVCSVDALIQLLNISPLSGADARESHTYQRSSNHTFHVDSLYFQVRGFWIYPASNKHLDAHFPRGESHRLYFCLKMEMAERCAGDYSDLKNCDRCTQVLKFE